jgi:hypothetical protein
MKIAHRIAISAFILIFTLGWLASAHAAEYAPSEADAAEIQRLSRTYFAHLDNGDHAAAYAMQTKGMKAITPYKEWLKIVRDSADALGALQRRDQTKVTWYDNPPNAPAPGLYVAVDYVSAYRNASQHSEYLVWYRERTDRPFALTRHETTIVLDQDASAPLPESKDNTIGYANVAAAREALSARSDVEIRTADGGWTIIVVPKENTVWTFTPENHPAHPAAIKRAPFEKDGAVYLGTNVLCQAKKPVCDALVRDFIELNKRTEAKMKERIENNRSP